MHIPLPSNSLAMLQTTGASSATSKQPGDQGALFSADLTGGQDLQGAGAAASGSPSTGGGLIAPSSLNVLLAQQADDSDGSDPLSGVLNPAGQGAQPDGTGSKNDLRHRFMLS